jgi:hypothetical protein
VRRALLALLLASCGRPPVGRALEALRAGDFAAAEALAEDAGDRALRDFIRGNAAFARSERAEARLKEPDAPPSLLERAAADAEDALVAWRLAAASRDDWPEARRNVERALLRLQRLREKGKEGGRGGPKPGQPPPDRAPVPPAPPPVPDEAGPAPEPEVDVSELPPERVLALLDALRRKELEKRALRRERRAAATDVERDW